MATFTGEEKLDLLLKKVAFGVTKTGTSQATGPDGEPLTSFTAVRPEHVFKDATTANIPTAPTANSTALVGVYKKDGTGSAGTNGEVQAPLAASAIASSANMPGFASGSGFKRAWDTGVNNWLGPAFGSDYAVKVYVGNSGWNGLASSMGSSNVVEVIFGADPNADWFFDYEAGVLYWTNEEASDDGSTTFDNSTNFVNTGVTSGAGTKITLGDIVYIQGYAYKGGVGVGSDSAATVTIAEDDTSSDHFLVFTSDAGSSQSLLIDKDDDGAGTGDYALKYNPGTNVLNLGAAVHSVSLTTGSFTLGGANVNSTAAELNLLDDSVGGSIVNSRAVIYDASGVVTRGIADDNLLEVDGTPVSGDFAQFTDNGLVSRTASQVLSDISALSTAGTAAKATAIAGGALGSVPYQSDANVTAFLAGNITTTNKFMRSVGDSSAAAAPTFAAIAAADVTGLGTLATTDISVAEATAVAHKVVLTTAAATGTLTGVQIDTADLTFTPSADTGRGLLTTGDLTVKGNLNVIGAGSYINLQQENVYMKDALITLGNEDDGADTDFADAAVMDPGTLLGIEAYKQNYNNSAHPSLVFDSTVGNKYWAIDNKDHAASVLTRVARIYKLAYTITSTDVTNGYFTITHQLNHKDVIVQVRDATQNIVFFTYTSQTVNTVRVAIGGGIAAANVFNVVVVG